jgi:Ca2+-binding EF-hand superfamily protein
MTIGGIWALGAADPSQLLTSMLSRLNSTSGNQTSTTGTPSPTATIANTPDNTLTGSSTGRLSDQILGLLTMMQNDPGASQSAAGTASSSTLASPLASLVSAIDTDGDGTISQGEMENYIEGKGGTQAQADTLFNALNQNGSGNLTQAQLQSDLQNAAPMHAHGHHHHHGGGPSADKVGSQLVQAMDTDGDGSVSQSEFENFVTGLGGTTAEADTDFTALNGQNGSGITANQFSSAITAFETANQSGSTAANPILTLLDDLAKNGSTA